MNVDLTPCGALGKIFYFMNQNLIEWNKNFFNVHKIPQKTKL